MPSNKIHNSNVEPPKKIPDFPTMLAEVELNPAGLSGKSKIKDSGGKDRRFSNVSSLIKQKLRGTREEGDFTLGCIKLLHTRTRFIILVLVLLCLASIWSNILAFNFALICMGTPEHSENGTDSTAILFTPNQRTALTSAVAASALVANFVVVSLVNQFGIRTVFTILGFISAIATCLMPLAVQAGFYYMLAARLLQGIAFAANFPVIGAFTSKWTYYKQNGLFVSVLVAYVQLSPAISMSASGSICSSFLGWPGVFYFHGIFSTIIFTTFFLFYRNSPGKHPYVGPIELRKIAVGKSECSKEELKFIPYGQILKTASVWAVWIAAIGNFTAVNMMFLFTPNYLNKVLHFQIQHTGFSASLPPLLQFLIKLLAGFTSDKIRFLSETNKLRLYNSVAFVGSAGFLTLLAFFPTEYTTICLMLLGLSAGILGFTTGGFFKAGPLVSKHFSHFVTGNVSLGITFTMLLVPFMVTGLAPNNTAEEWRWVFIWTAAVLTLTNLLFVLMCSAEPAPWTTDEFSRNASRNRIHATQPTRIKEFAPEVIMG
uniref:Major facilitator superfamily (MFS) profile domain-containing protein n=1 Tax=Acrobeloides nanus TaxID=290746 RepID=A0A914EE34_9BILA